MSILDQDITTYVLKWEGVENIAFKLKAKIEKESGEEIGNIETKGLFTKKIFLKDLNKSVLLKAVKSGVGIVAKYNVYDADDNKIAVIKQKLFSRKKIMIMKNSKDEEILKFEGSSFLKGNHQINFPNGENLAVFSRKQDVVKTGKWKSKLFSTCTLQIKKPDFDRKILLAMFISCLSSYVDYTETEFQSDYVKYFRK